MAHLIGGNANSDLNIGNGVVLIAKGSDEGAVRSLNIINKSDKPSIAVFSDKRLPRFIWNRADGAPSSGVYQDNIRFAPTPVILTTRSMVESLEIKWYPVSVCGTQVTTINYKNIQNQYIVGGLYDTYSEDAEEDGIETGPVYFNPRTNQLRLSSSINTRATARTRRL